MISGSVQVLEGENAIAAHRDVMGATNPADAARILFAANSHHLIDENACHGSDLPQTAKVEIDYFFTAEELCERTR